MGRILHFPEPRTAFRATGLPHALKHRPPSARPKPDWGKTGTFQQSQMVRPKRKPPTKGGSLPIFVFIWNIGAETMPSSFFDCL
jgi:hypothetical protein